MPLPTHPSEFRTRSRESTWRFFNNRLAFFIVAASLLFGSFVDRWNVTSRYSGYWQANPFSGGLWQECLGGLLLGWAAYLWRVNLQHFFQPQLIYVRAPLMLAAAPLIMARSRDLGIAERHGVSIDLDFRYAGRTALDDLFSVRNSSPFAVASDVAICHYLFEAPNRRIRIMPFVKLQDQIRILVRRDPSGNPEFKNVADLVAATVGLSPDTIHSDFLTELLPGFTGRTVNQESVLASYRELASKTVDAVVLWEPHYQAFANTPEIAILETKQPYEWYLCLVARDLGNSHLARRLSEMLFEASAFCRDPKNRAELIKHCASYLHTEFTGIDTEGLGKLLDTKGHLFGVDTACSDFGTRVDKLAAKGGAIGVGASHVRNAIWQGLSLS